ncbi:MAG: hypothetical protein ACYC1L_09700 [Alphaproteobacteria bacterium]
MLISFHLASRHPDKLRLLLDNIERTAADPSRIEVLVKIDDEDEAMQAFVAAQAGRWRFSFRHISTPRGEGYFGLWSAYNDLLKICHPDAYFVSLINDEVLFQTPHWDDALLRYKGFFPDHLFRLRISRFRLRNYRDFWEPGYAPDSYAIYTKRWFDIGGDWCPCNTPDSFQQSVAFYLWSATRPSDANRQFSRDVPIWDIHLEGEEPYRGLSDDELRYRVRVAERHWFRLMSWSFQTEASHRAHRLLAYLRASAQHLPAYSIESDITTKTVSLVEQPSGKVLERTSYALNRFRIVAVNRWRMPLFEYYCGGSWDVVKIHLRIRFDRTIARYNGYRAKLREILWRLRASMTPAQTAVATPTAPANDARNLVSPSFEPWGSAEVNEDTYAAITRARPMRARRVVLNLFSPSGRAHVRDLSVVAANRREDPGAPWRVIPSRLVETDYPLPYQERVTVPPDPDFSRVTLEIDRNSPAYGAYDTWGIACLSASRGDRRNWLPEGQGIYLRRLRVA